MHELIVVELGYAQIVAECYEVIVHERVVGN